MPHPVHSVLQRFLDTQQYAFDPRERALWPSERFPQAQQTRTKDAAEPARKRSVYAELGHQS